MTDQYTGVYAVKHRSGQVVPEIYCVTKVREGRDCKSVKSVVTHPRTDTPEEWFNSPGRSFDLLGRALDKVLQIRKPERSWGGDGCRGWS